MGIEPTPWRIFHNLYVRSLCCAPQAYTVLYVNYIPIKLEEKDEKKRKRRNSLGLDTVKPVHEYFRVIGRLFLCLWLISMMLHSW